MEFNQLNLRPEILRAIAEMGYDKPTSIQAKAIPEILQGEDVTGRSSTGTGKTAAFGIPLVQRAAESDEKASVLILSPTRELAMQIAGELRKFTKYLPSIPLAAVYGGESMEYQIRQLRTAKIVIGTPGRIMDHLRRKTLRLDHLETIVLDEADEMLNMGFIDDIHTILETAPPLRQTLLFSATMSQAIMDISKTFQDHPVTLQTDQGKRTVAKISQSFYNIPQAGKLDTLKLLLEYHRPKRALIFCNTKRGVDDLTNILSNDGYNAVAIHGDLRQSVRTAVMNQFKDGRANILIATDVAARGIDVEDVEAVFNYDIPLEDEYYIHRIGRTGRAGKEGKSFTLVANGNQLARLRGIQHYTKSPIDEMPVPTLENIREQQRKAFARNIEEAIENGIGRGERKAIDALVAKGYDAEDIAAVLYAKAAGKNKRLESVHDVASFGGKKTVVNGKGRRWIRVNIGSSDKIAPNFIVGAIVEATNMPPSKIGKINIFADHTDVDMNQTDADEVIRKTNGLRIKGKPVFFSWTEGSGNAFTKAPGGSGKKGKGHQQRSNHRDNAGQRSDKRRSKRKK